jgi:DNA-directed RNA polymerase subunit L
LDRLPFFGHVLHCWKYAGGAQNAKAWISKNATENAGILAKLADSQLTHTLGSNIVYEMDEPPDPELYDYRLLHDATKIALAKAKLTAEQRAQIEAFSRGLMHLLEQQAKREAVKQAARELKEPADESTTAAIRGEGERGGDG